MQLRFAHLVKCHFRIGTVTFCFNDLSMSQQGFQPQTLAWLNTLTVSQCLLRVYVLHQTFCYLYEHWKEKISYFTYNGDDIFVIHLTFLVFVWIIQIIFYSFIRKWVGQGSRQCLSKPFPKICVCHAMFKDPIYCGLIIVAGEQCLWPSWVTLANEFTSP